MRIAFPSEDGVTIHRHFGQASHYAVVTVEDGAATGLELRSKEAHHHGHDHDHGHEHSHDRDHAPMFAPVSDCQVLIAGGMGRPALVGAEASGLEVILTTEHEIDQAVQSYLAGTLVNHLQLAHAPGRHQH